MKGLKKIALATAVAAAPFAAQAELQAMDDSMMGNVTGQAGVTIELETQVSIGQFTYTDEGTFAVKDIELGGAGVTGVTEYQNAAGQTVAVNGLLDQLKIDIDINDDGDAVIEVGTLDGNSIDWGMTAGSMELEGNGGENTVLVSNMSAWGLLSQLDIVVDTDDVDNQAGTGTLNIDAAFTVEDMNFDVEFLGIGVRGMTVRSSESGGETLGAQGLAAIFAEDPTAPTAAEAKKIGLAQAGYAIIGLDIYKGGGLGASTATDVLRVDVDDVLMDINVAETVIGGANIGTIGIDNLHISNTKLAVYGK